VAKVEALSSRPARPGVRVVQLAPSDSPRGTKAPCANPGGCNFLFAPLFYDFDSRGGCVVAACAHLWLLGDRPAPRWRGQRGCFFGFDRAHSAFLIASLP